MVQFIYVSLAAIRGERAVSMAFCWCYLFSAVLAVDVPFPFGVEQYMAVGEFQWSPFLSISFFSLL